VLYLRTFHNNTSATLVPTHTQRTNLEEMGFKNVRVISRGVDCALFKPSQRSPALRKQWGADDTTSVCLYVGRLAHEKNISLIAEYIKDHTHTSSKQLFVFVGDGPARAELEQSCPEAIFAGMQKGEDLAQHYASADIFLFPSKTDTFGNVVTEAMASRLAVVAFNDAAAKEHLRDGESGYISQIDHDSDFHKKLSCAIKQKDQREDIRNTALELADSIRWSNIVDQLEDCLVHNKELTTGERYGHSEKLNSL